MKHEPFQIQNRGRFCVEINGLGENPVETFDTVANAILWVAKVVKDSGEMKRCRSGVIYFEVKPVSWTSLDTDPQVHFWTPMSPGRKFSFGFDLGLRYGTWVILEDLGKGQNLLIAQGSTSEKI